jgi:hypothetical protein
VRFDERLGVGKELGFGEELVFLRQLVDKGLTGWRVPQPIATHVDPTTGDLAIRQLGTRELRTIGALSYCKWGPAAVLLWPKEAVRLALVAGRLMSVPMFAWHFLTGIRKAHQLGLGRRANGDPIS